MINLAKEIETLLMTKRSEDDVVATLSMPEHKFKKISDKFNDVLIEVYNNHKNDGIRMRDILLSLHAHFEIEYMVETLLNIRIKDIVKTEYSTNIVNAHDTKNNSK
jgi:hypothetical protein